MFGPKVVDIDRLQTFSTLFACSLRTLFSGTTLFCLTHIFSMFTCGRKGCSSSRAVLGDIDCLDRALSRIVSTLRFCMISIDCSSARRVQHRKHHGLAGFVSDLLHN